MSLMGLDIGTTGTKANVLSEDGRVIASAYREYPLEHPRPGWIELDADRVWQCVRQAVGDDYLLLYRLGGNDYMPGGLTQEEGKRAALELVAAGVDLLDISGGLCGASVPGWDEVSQGYFVPMAAEIRAAVSVHVVVAGGITEPEFADRVIRAGKVDLVAIGRAMLSNPDWAAEARKISGRGP